MDWVRATAAAAAVQRSKQDAWTDAGQALQGCLCSSSACRNESRGALKAGGAAGINIMGTTAAAGDSADAGQP